jgi:hypothetical protein
MKTIEELIRLTPEQEQLCKEMEALYQKMEAAGIAFAQNEDAEVVVYNATEIEDCESFGVWGDGPDGYEYAEQNDMRRLFPIWCAEDLWVKRKE